MGEGIDTLISVPLPSVARVGSMGLNQETFAAVDAFVEKTLVRDDEVLQACS